MIGLRQDIMQQQCKKKNQVQGPLSITSIAGDDSNANNTTAESKDTDVDDIIEQFKEDDDTTQLSKDDDCDNTSNDGSDNINVGDNRGASTSATGSITNSQHSTIPSEVDKRINQQTKLTKIKLNNNGYYISLLRDLIMISIPFIIMIGILTHPMVVNLGQSDPNAPLTEKQIQEQLLYTLFLKKQQKELCEKYMFLNAMDDRRCYDDCPVIDITAKLIDKQKKNKKGRPRTKRGQAVSKRRLADQRIKQQQAQKNIPGSGIPRKKRSDNRPRKKKGNKMNRPINRKDGPAPAPILTLFSGTPTQKGAEDVANKRSIFTDNPLRKFKRKKMKLSKEQKEVWEKVSNKYNRYQ